jgi:hypothetical protein
MSAIDDELKKRETESETGKAADVRKSELAAIIAKRDQAQKTYAAKVQALTERWQELVTQFNILRKGVASEYGDLPDQFKKVCTVIDAIKAHRKDRVEKRRGANEISAVGAAENVAVSKARLDAWLALDNWLGTRLNEADSGLKKVEALLGDDNQIFSIYLLWFKVRPILMSIAPDGKTKVDDGPEPACLDPLDDHRVRLIDPGDYGGRVDTAQADYDAARKAKQTADDTFKASPDDLAGELKKLKDLTDGADLAANNALKPPKA